MMTKLKRDFNVGHCALWLKNRLYLSSQGWFDLHEADKTLLYLYMQVHNDSIITDIPVYLTHTALIEDISKIGYIPYRFVIMQLSEYFTLTIIIDDSIELNDLYDFVRKSVNKEMSRELTRESVLVDIGADFMAPLCCLAWVFRDTRHNCLRSYCYKDREEHEITLSKVI